MLKLTNVHKSFDKTEVLKGISLNVEKGSVTAIIGPSGAGKTTLLRLIAGFQKADSGEIINGEITLFDDKFFMSPQKRQIGFLHSLLFKNELQYLVL